MFKHSIYIYLGWLAPLKILNLKAGNSYDCWLATPTLIVSRLTMW